MSAGGMLYVGAISSSPPSAFRSSAAIVVFITVEPKRLFDRQDPPAGVLVVELLRWRGLHG
jgi:hypothetical protein